MVVAVALVLLVILLVVDVEEVAEVIVEAGGAKVMAICVDVVAVIAFSMIVCFFFLVAAAYSIGDSI